jgi:DNA primase
VRLAIALLLQHPELAAQVDDVDSLRDLEAAGLTLLLELLERLHRNPNLTAGSLLEHWRDTPEHAQLARLIAWEHGVPALGTTAEFQGVVARLRALAREQRTDRLLDKARTNGLTREEKQELVQLLAQGGGQATVVSGA